MNIINKLDYNIQSQIRSDLFTVNISSCVFELVKNAIEAEATCVAIKFNFKTFKLQIIDNGRGIRKNHLDIIGLRYYTTKQNNVLQKNNSKLNRGETLASIKNISSCLMIISRTAEEDVTYCKVLMGRKNFKVVKALYQRLSKGTTIIINNILGNLPIRQKRVIPSVEIQNIKRYIRAFALMYCSVNFTVIDDTNNTDILKVDRTQSTYKTFIRLFPGTIQKYSSMVKLTSQIDNIKIKAMIYKGTHRTCHLQFVYVNKRYVAHSDIRKYLNKRLMKMFFLKDVSKSQTLLPKIHRYPIFILNICCSAELYNFTFQADVVEFKNTTTVKRCLIKLIEKFIYCDISINEKISKINKKNVADNFENFKTKIYLPTRAFEKLNKARTVFGLPVNRQKRENYVNNYEINTSHKNVKNLTTKCYEITNENHGNEMEQMGNIISNFSLETPLVNSSEKLILSLSHKLYDLNKSKNNFETNKFIKVLSNNNENVEKVNFNNYGCHIAKTYLLNNSNYLVSDKLYCQIKLSEENYLKINSNIPFYEIKKKYNLKRKNFKLLEKMLRKQYMDGLDYYKNSFFKNTKRKYIKKRTNYNSFQHFTPEKLQQNKRILKPPELKISDEVYFKFTNIPYTPNNNNKNDNIDILKYKNINQHTFLIINNRDISHFESKIQNSNSKNKENYRNIFFEDALITDAVTNNNIEMNTKDEFKCRNLLQTSENFIQSRKHFSEYEDIFKNNSHTEMKISISDFDLDAKYQFGDHSINAEQKYMEGHNSEIHIFEDVNFNTNKKIDDLNFSEKLNNKKLHSVSANLISENNSLSVKNINSQESCRYYSHKPNETLTNKVNYINQKNSFISNNNYDLILNNYHTEERNTETYFNFNPNKFDSETNVKKNISKIVTNVNNNLNLKKYNSDSNCPEEFQQYLKLVHKKAIDVKNMEVEENFDHLNISNQIFVEKMKYKMNSKFLFYASVFDVPKGILNIQKLKTKISALPINSKKHKLQLMNSMRNHVTLDDYGNSCLRIYPLLKECKNAANNFNIADEQILKDINCSIMFYKSDLKSVRFLTQIDKKFLLASIILNKNKDEVLIAFDQHAIDERIRVERLHKKYVNKNGIWRSVYVNPPIYLNIPLSDASVIMDFCHCFEKNGIHFELSKSNLESDKSVIIGIKKVPACLYDKAIRETTTVSFKPFLKELVQSLIEELIKTLIETNGVTQHVIPNALQNVINNEACRGAIKFGHKLSYDICVTLLKSLLLCNVPFQCAHGRPSIIPLVNFSKLKQLEKQTEKVFFNKIKQQMYRN